MISRPRNVASSMAGSHSQTLSVIFILGTRARVFFVDGLDSRSPYRDEDSVRLNVDIPRGPSNLFRALRHPRETVIHLPTLNIASICGGQLFWYGGRCSCRRRTCGHFLRAVGANQGYCSCSRPFQLPRVSCGSLDVPGRGGKRGDGGGRGVRNAIGDRNEFDRTV